MNHTPAPLDVGLPSVLHLSTTFHPIVGGAQIATHRLAQALTNRGVDVAVATRKIGSSIYREEIDGVSVLRWGTSSESRLGALSYGLAGFWHLATDSRRYRLIHVQNPDTPLLLGLLAKILLRRKLILTIHGEEKLRRLGATAPGRLRIRLMRTFVDMWTALTPAVQEAIASQGVPTDRIRLIANGVDLAEFQPATPPVRLHARSELHLKPDACMVLFVGRLHESKRVEDLLSAWSVLRTRRPASLFIVGDGPQADVLEESTARMSLSRVTFTGARHDVATLLHAADILVLPSAHEGLPVVLIEAAAAGVPAVVSAIPGNEFVISHDETGLVFAVGDSATLSKQLARLIDDEELRGRMGREATKRCRARFSLEQVVDLHERLYLDLVR